MSEEKKNLEPGDALPEGWVWARRKQDDEIMPLYGPNWDFKGCNHNDFELLEKYNVDTVEVERKADGEIEEVEVIIPECTPFQEAEVMPVQFNKLKQSLKSKGISFHRTAKMDDLRKLWLNS